MNYAEAIDEFAAIFTDAQHAPLCVSLRSYEQLAIYRHNVRLNRVAVLAEIFPTIKALLGEAFFQALADVYVARYDSYSANLHDDGRDFADFLRDFPHVQDTPYLPDVARLDLALHRSHYAVDSPGLAIDALAAYPAEVFAQARFVFHPACVLVQSSQWPIASILDFHQGGAQPDWHAGGENVWVWRDHYQKCAADEIACLQVWCAGGVVEAGLDAAVDINPNFDPSNLLIRLFQHGHVIAIETGEQS